MMGRRKDGEGRGIGVQHPTHAIGSNKLPKSQNNLLITSWGSTFTSSVLAHVMEPPSVCSASILRSRIHFTMHIPARGGLALYFLPLP